jgi:elongation factor G
MRPAITVTDLKTNDETKIACKESEPLTAFVFKTIADPYVGRLSLFRVFAGTLKKDTPIYNVRSEMMETRDACQLEESVHLGPDGYCSIRIEFSP